VPRRTPTSAPPTRSTTSRPLGRQPLLSVVVPVRDGAAFLSRALPPLVAALPDGAELIVCDDGSRDGSGRVAAAVGARVVLVGDLAGGPAAARNRGALVARGEILVFLDADVTVHPDTLGLLTRPFADPSVAAAFGSYDDTPPESSWISRYKNLAHHFVHQRSREDASTFWAGCGAVRRGVFLGLGGFDEGYRRPSIEDVELGYRLREAGYRIRLVREAQVSHLKEWTLGSWLVSDLRDRAIPWARLVRAGRGLPRDLNFTTLDRLAALMVASGVSALALSALDWRLGAGAALPLAAAVAIDAPFLRFAARRSSAAFAAAAAGLHMAHRAAAVAGFLVGYMTPGPKARRHRATHEGPDSGAPTRSEVTGC